MKTIKEVADICGMSKSSVSRVIKELNIQTEMFGNKNIVKDEDVKRIYKVLRGYEANWCDDATAEAETPKADNNASKQPEAEKNEENSSIPVSSVLAEHSEIIKFLMEQLKERDLQIKQLQEDNDVLIKAQAYTLKNLQTTLLLNEKDESITEPEEQKKTEEEIENNIEPVSATSNESTSTNLEKKWWQFWK